MASEGYRKKILALWEIRDTIGEKDRWASCEYAGEGTKSGFIQNMHHFNIELRPNRDLTDKQKFHIDKLITKWITGFAVEPEVQNPDSFNPAEIEGAETQTAETSTEEPF